MAEHRGSPDFGGVSIEASLVRPGTEGKWNLFPADKNDRGVCSSKRGD